MIYCVWYPSGGFGHFINAILSLHGNNFARPKNRLEFSKNGNSHSLDLVAPKYYKNQNYYDFIFDPQVNYSVLIDNGIDDQTTEFKKFFPESKIFKMCYNDYSWPVVAYTMIAKAMEQNLNQVLTVDSTAWLSTESWVQREKYFLFLRDHGLRRAWQPDTLSIPIMIDELMNYHTIRQTLKVDVEDFRHLWDQWWDANKKYFLPIITAKKILQGEFEYVNDPWTQAVVYYQIWCEYGVEVPHNDYSNWFESHEQIVKMLNDHGVNIDSI